MATREQYIHVDHHLSDFHCVMRYLKTSLYFFFYNSAFILNAYLVFFSCANTASLENTNEYQSKE